MWTSRPSPIDHWPARACCILSRQYPGIVVDQTGAALPGVTISARDVGKGIATVAVSSGTGRYTIPYLPTGDYEITFTLSGFKPVVTKGIELHVNDRREVNATMGLAGVSESVEVSGAAQLI